MEAPYFWKHAAQKHGPLMHLQLGEISTIVVSSPRLAEEIMKTHDLAFANRAILQQIKIGMYDCKDIAFAPYGDYWRQMRKICTSELLNAKTVRSFSPIRQAEALRLVSSIQALANAEAPINIAEKMHTYTSTVICDAAFGEVSRDDKNALIKLFFESTTFSKYMDISDFFPSYKLLHRFSFGRAKLLKLHRKSDKILSSILHQHTEKLAGTKMPGTGESGHEDLIDVLLRIKESGELPLEITNEHIKAIMLDLFVGGLENSSATVEWAMAEMIRNPNVLAKAQYEIRTAFPANKTIEETDIQKLVYLKLVIKETLRLYPPAPLLVPKECRIQCEIDGYVIPIKTKVIVNAWAIGREPYYWDDPDSFRPERFENSSIDFMGNHFKYIPFGAGRRMCPGISFGLANVELPLALLLYHFDWKLPNGLKSNALDMTETMASTAHKKDNLCLLATMYNPSPDISVQALKES